MNTPHSSHTHIVPYPFGMVPTLEGKISGGLPAVFAAEFAANKLVKNRVLSFFTTDTASQNYPLEQVRISIAEPSTYIPPFGEWFSHRWLQLHPEAHTAVTLDDEVLSRMFTGSYNSPKGTLDRGLEHCETYPLSDRGNVEHFIARFRPLLDQVVREAHSETTINWQDPLFFAELQNEYAPALREAGVRQTCHVHTVVPSSLHQSPWGRVMLSSLAKMDRVFVHTEGYRSALEQQLEQMGEGQPAVDRFDLMIDTPLLRTICDQADDIRSMPDYADLDTPQRMVVDEVIGTSEGVDSVPHRFLCLDRADPGKGVTVMIQAIEQFLDEQRTQGVSVDELRRLYRFFSFHDQLPLQGKPFEPSNVKEQYAHVVRERYNALQKKYPGIIHCTKSVSKSLAVRLMDNCHALTACAQDGLNLAWPEAVWLNAYRGRNRFGIMAQGAGFAQEAIRRGMVHSPELFPAAGNVDAFKHAISVLVKKSEGGSDSLLASARELSACYIDLRKDSVIVEA